MAGNPIHINPAHKGMLHEDLGKKGPLTMADLYKGKRSKNPAVRKRANFALVARTKFHHGGAHA